MGEASEEGGIEGTKTRKEGESRLENVWGRLWQRSVVEGGFRKRTRTERSAARVGAIYRII